METIIPVLFLFIGLSEEIVMNYEAHLMGVCLVRPYFKGQHIFKNSNLC